ncbi:MAG: Ig-like domain-containing protein [Desulfosporosinus sp.]|nr:Ig-like domain-containing protein [Desulfosporosinus sp.]
MFIAKGFKALGGAIVPILIFSQTAMAVPSMITYKDATSKNIVSANYSNVLSNDAMKSALKGALTSTELVNFPLFVTDSNGSIIDYEAALGKSENYATALTDSSVIATTAPVATYQMNNDGSVTPISAPPVTGTGISTLVGNAIPNINTEGVKPLTLKNVVLLGDTAKLQAKLTDASGNAVSGQTVTFTINSADTFSSVSLPKGSDPDTHKYVASATFDNSQKTITAVTGADGIATANVTASVTPNEAKTQKEILTDKYAATEVTYNASANGVINTGAVSFATFDQNDVDVQVAPVKDASPIIGHTLGIYPFSDTGTQTTLENLQDTEYAVGQKVSALSGSPDNTLKVSATLDLNVYSSLVDSNIQNLTTKTLTHSQAGILPNETNVWTEPNLVIPDRVNYATLHFNSMSLSKGTEITVYFVPDSIVSGSYTNVAPNGVDTDPTAQSLNGHFVGSSGTWAKTFAVDANADSYVDNNFALQIPANLSKGTVYVVTQAPGQIDPVTNIGYTLSSIDMNYGALATLVKANVGSYVNWTQVPQISYSQAVTLTKGSAEEAKLMTDLNYAGQTVDSTWTFKYKVPVYPMVGDAIVQAYDGFNALQKQWSMPTTNHLSNGQINQNGLVIGFLIDYEAIRKSPDLIIPLAIDADFTTPAQATMSQANGVAFINSTHTGPQEIKGTINIPNVPNNLLNSLADNVYSYAQWLPLEIYQGPYKANNEQYALTGQNVTLTALVTDANGNLVETPNLEVAFDVITSDNNLSAVSATGKINSAFINDGTLDTDQVTGAQPAGKHYRYHVQTDTFGKATLTLSAPNVASVIAQASAIAAVDPKTGAKTYYNVALSDPAGAVGVTNGKLLTQIDFGSLALQYVPEQGLYNQNSQTGVGTINKQTYDPTTDPTVIAAAHSSAVAGNAQNFGILPSVTWPTNPVFEHVFVDSGIHTVQGLAASTVKDATGNIIPVDVTGIPFTVTNVDGSVGTVQQVTSSTSTTSNPAGLTNWTALSNVIGQETIMVSPKMDAPSWNNVQIVNGTTQITEAGTGLVTPVNSLTIPIKWRVGMGAAVVSVPSSTANIGGSVPIKVMVTDANGNPIVGEDVRFTLTTSKNGKAILDQTELTTDAKGQAIANLSGGIDAEQDGVTVVVEDPTTGSVIPVTNGQQNIVWQQQVKPLSYLSAVPNTVPNPNTIVLNFNHDVNSTTVDPKGSQFVVTDLAGNTYALQSAAVSGQTITLTLANKNSELGKFYGIWGAFEVTINPTNLNLQVGDNFNNVIANGTPQIFTIPAPAVVTPAATTPAAATPAAATPAAATPAAATPAAATPAAATPAATTPAATTPAAATPAATTPAVVTPAATATSN